MSLHDVSQKGKATGGKGVTASARSGGSGGGATAAAAAVGATSAGRRKQQVLTRVRGHGV
jgi:hypothetical protein